MVKKKKPKKALIKKPNWVGDVDLTNCVDGLVYHIYQCRKCIIEYKVDHLRLKRKKFMLLPGNKKKQNVEICNCKIPTPLLIKYKRCPCGAEYWGFYLREKQTCKVCGAYNNDIGLNPISYYRLLDFYKKTSDDLTDETRWDCLNRSICLLCSREQGSKRGIACKDCPYYEKGSL